MPDNPVYLQQALEADVARGEGDDESVETFNSIFAYARGRDPRHAEALCHALCARVEILIENGQWLSSVAVARRAVRVAARCLDIDSEPRVRTNAALAKAQDIKAKMAETGYLAATGRPVRLAASFGIATYPDDARDLEGLLALGDQALFSVKRTGRGGIAAANARRRSAPMR